MITIRVNWTPEAKGSLGVDKLTISGDEIAYSTLTDVDVSHHYPLIYGHANPLYPLSSRPPSIFPSFGLSSP